MIRRSVSTAAAAWLIVIFAAGARGQVENAALGVLEKRCMACHSNAAKTSGLDLSSRETALQGGAKGPALVPGDPEKSLLYQFVAEGKMPIGERLPSEEREVLRIWIEAGAPWSQAIAGPAPRPRAGSDWWSLQPLDHADIPQPEGIPQAWSHSRIDRFTYAAMRQKNLQPAAPADRRVLIRRVTFDLLGLPPTPAEVEAFVNDPADDAYEKLIDRLLASPHYGERWGRHWLDVIRFGESHGYEQNHLRNNAWPFRDYIIRSFNEDKPFDQMVLEQLAGDQLAAGNPDVEVATGFLVAGPHDTVGIENIEGRLQQRADDLDDIIKGASESFLGLTVGCARCHDHKFDPIKQADYYQMRAVFEGVQHAERILATPQESLEYEVKQRPLAEEIERLTKGLTELKDRSQSRVDQQKDAIEGRYRSPIDDQGTEETFEEVEARFVRMRITATNRGAAAVDEFEVWTSGPKPHIVSLASAGAKATAKSTREDNGDPTFYKVDYVVDGKYANTWISADNGSGEFTIELPKTETIQRVFWSRDRLGANQGRFNSSVPTQYAIDVSVDGKKWVQVADSSDRLPFAKEEREELVLLAVFSEPEKNEWRSLKARKEETEQKLKDLKQLPKAYVGQFKQPESPTYLFQRGDPMKKGDVTPPASLSTLETLFPGFQLDPEAPEGERRLALARWITDDGNALTPRVLANRVWHYHFGRGLVGTPSDFGFNGARPTHPELLDYLAHRLHLYGWRLKPFHKELLMSMTYRQSSGYNAQFAEVDSDALYLWRFPPHRLEAEAIRDSILAVSGKLNDEAGGPSFRLYKYTVDNVATYLPLQEFDKQTYRRAVYHQAARSVSVGLLGEYDQPDCSAAAPKREVSTSPLQALTMLNNDFVLDQARFFADRLRSQAGEDVNGQVQTGYLLAFGRAPDGKELAASIDFVEQYGLELLCRAIFNANEFIYVM